MTDKLRDQIRSSRDIKENSLDTYISSIKKIHRAVDPKCKEDADDCEFLHNYDDVMDFVDSEAKLTTKKNRLTAVLVALGSEEPKDEILIKKYGNALKDLNDEYSKFIKKQQKTPTQKKNWITYARLVDITNELRDEVDDSGITLKEKKTLSRDELDLLQQYVILRTYITFPLRNDFADMRVIKAAAWKKMTKKRRSAANYLVLLPKNKKEFHINLFKTAKSLGPKVLSIPPKLNKLINLWLKFNKSGFFMVKKNGSDPISANGITKFLNKLFSEYADGKKISTSMLRHIVISHLLKGQKTIAQKERESKTIENTFMHSAEMNQLYRKVDDEIS
jgi:integrase